jgi:hypothetical protein
MTLRRPGRSERVGHATQQVDRPIRRRVQKAAALEIAAVHAEGPHLTEEPEAWTDLASEAAEDLIGKLKRRSDVLLYRPRSLISRSAPPSLAPNYGRQALSDHGVNL